MSTDLTAIQNKASSAAATARANAINNLTSATASRADASSIKLADDFESFLKLLTTQLKNQDPTEPLDTNEFTNQLVLFASVEQQIASNKNLEALVAAATRSTIDSSVAYIGKTVEAEGNSAQLKDGRAEFVYSLDSVASDVNVTILDSSGAAVYTTKGETSSGRHSIIWDGKNSFNGNQMPDGIYTIVVNATDSNGETLPSKTYTVGRVTAVELGNDGNMNLVIGDEKVDATRVVAVRETTDNSNNNNDDDSADNG